MRLASSLKNELTTPSGQRDDGLYVITSHLSARILPDESQIHANFCVWPASSQDRRRACTVRRGSYTDRITFYPLGTPRPGRIMCDAGLNHRNLLRNYAVLAGPLSKPLN